MCICNRMYLCVFATMDWCYSAISGIWEKKCSQNQKDSRSLGIIHGLFHRCVDVLRHLPCRTANVEVALLLPAYQTWWHCQKHFTCMWMAKPLSDNPLSPSFSILDHPWRTWCTGCCLHDLVLHVDLASLYNSSAKGASNQWRLCKCACTVSFLYLSLREQEAECTGQGQHNCQQKEGKSLTHFQDQR